MYGKRNTAQTQGSVLGLDQQTFPARIRTYRYATHRVPPKAIYWLDVRWKALRRHLVLWTENLKAFEKNKVTVVVKFDGGSRNATAFAIFFYVCRFLVKPLAGTQRLPWSICLPTVWKQTILFNLIRLSHKICRALIPAFTRVALPHIIVARGQKKMHAKCLSSALFAHIFYFSCNVYKNKTWFL